MHTGVDGLSSMEDIPLIEKRVYNGPIFGVSEETPN